MGKKKKIACLIHENEQRALYLMFNAGTDAVGFSLPHARAGASWHLAVDTSREAPRDLYVAGEEQLLNNQQTYRLSPRSGVILLTRNTQH